MAESSDELICRVCRGPGTPANQLYHPCKCSGSMKFVHQECLEEWLSHSNRKHCDICNFKYNFTPIYNPETPNQISLNFFTSILFRKAVKALKFYLRCILAVSLWLIVLPFLTTAIWRFWFDPKGMFDIKARAKNSTFVQGSVNVSNLTQFTPLSDTFNASNPKVTVVPLDNVGVFVPILNFTVGYLQFVAKSVIGHNSSIWENLNGAFPLVKEVVETVPVAPIFVPQPNVDIDETVDWLEHVKYFFSDVFEGQILLSILIIVAIGLLCVKEYVVLNTPVDAAGNPIRLPEGMDIADLPAGVPPPPPPAAAQPRRQPRNRQPRPQNPIPPAAPPPQPQLNPAEAARRAAFQREAHHRETLRTLERTQQRVFDHALQDPSLSPDEIMHIFRRAFDAQTDETHRSAVVAAAHRAVDAARARDEERAFIFEIFMNDCITRVREAGESAGSSPDVIDTLIDAFKETAKSLDMHECDLLVKSIESDMKGVRRREGLRRGSDVSEGIERVVEKVRRKGSLASRRELLERRRDVLRYQFEREEREERREREEWEKAERDFMRQVEREEPDDDDKEDEDVEVEEEDGVHQPPGQALNTMRTVEEDLEVIKELGMYMSMRHGTRVVDRPVIPPRGMSLESVGRSSGAPNVPGAGSSSMFENAESGESSNQKPEAFQRDEEFEAILRDFEESSAAARKGKKRAIESSERSPVESHASDRYSLRSRKNSPQVEPAPMQDTAQLPEPPIMQHPPPPRLPVFAFEAPLANDDMPPLEPPIAPHPNPFILEQPLPPQQPAEPIQNDALPDLQPRPRRAVQPAARRARQPRNGNNNLGNDNDAFNLNVNAELGPDGLAVDIQAQGDVNAFMELVGIQGPIDLLFQNFALALFIVFAALGAGGWVPFVCGKLILWLFFDVYSVAVGEVMEKGIVIISKVTDPILDPVVDGLVVLVKWSGLVAVSNATLAAVVNGTINNATVEVLKEPVVVEVVPNSADEKAQLSPGLKDVMDQIEKGSENGRKMPLDSVTVSITLTGNVSTNGTIVQSFDHSKPSQRFEFVSDRIANIVVGYLTIIFVAYHQARRSGHLRHPYVQTMKRMVYKGLRFLILAIKFSFFITIELGMFPTFCGLLIDLCTLSVFGPETTVESRMAFYTAYPWTSYFLHWLAGTTFMFQFAGYVQNVRKVVRPGVVWFIRDPDDPQFHPMQDIIEKPFLTQLRKLGFGAMMYAMVVATTVGGFVGLVHLLQNLIGADQGPAKFWPVKWEFSEPLSEFPIDLLIFHFLVPAVASWIRPKDMIVAALKAYFRFAARRLRLTNFLFGERAEDEENGEVGEDPIVIRVFEANEEGGVAPENGEVAVGEGVEGIQQNDANEDTTAVKAPVPAAIAAPIRPASARATPYMRVPHHDRIPLKPGQKVMVPMTRDGPLVGRPGETEDDIRSNWTRVYVPGNLRIRFLALMFFQWISGTILAVLLTIGPLYVGRWFFVSLHTYFTHQPLTLVASTSSPNEATFIPLNSTSSDFSLRRFRFLPPKNSTSFAASNSSGRPDLPVHDLFSLAFGLLVFIGVWMLSIWIHKGFVGLKEWYRRALADEADPATPGEKLWKAVGEGAKWGMEQVVVHASITGKALFVTFWVGIIIPALFGLLFEIYVVVPFVGEKMQTRVFFILQDWALGAIYTKVVHSIIMNAPDTELRRTLVQARDQVRLGGLRRFELRPVALKVIFPIVLISVGLVFMPPFVVLLMDLVEGDGMVIEGGEEWSDLLARLLVPVLMGLFVLYETVRGVRRAIKHWMDQVRDEHYLVGRRLRNLGDPVPIPVVAGPATTAQNLALEPEAVPLLAEEDDDWLDQVD